MTSGGNVVANAKTWLGVPYVYGGASRSGADCSGFIQRCFAELNVVIPRDTVGQLGAGKTIDGYTNALPGDCVYFSSGPGGGVNDHAGIVSGTGMMIDSPHTGAVVRYDPILTFGERIVGYRRFWDQTAGDGNMGLPGMPSVPGVSTLGDIAGLLTNLIKVFEFPIKAGRWLADKHNLIRIVEGFLGIVAIIMGIYIVNSGTIDPVIGSTIQKFKRVSEVAAVA